MAIYIKSGKRGRPISIDVIKELENFDLSIAKVKNRLAQFREETRGERDVGILGSPTSLPQNITATYDVLEALKDGIYINYATAKQLKENLKTIKQLSSNQERVFGRALAKVFTDKYVQDLEYMSRNSSKFVKNTYKNLANSIKKMTPQQQQKFFLSRDYQSPKTNNKNYQKVIAWAQNDIKNKTGDEVQLTGEEALAYVFQHKMEKYIATL